jgi:hypothetical protein
MEYTLALLILAALVAVIVTRPLRRRGEADRLEDARRANLVAAKAAKYREIRDAELDFRMGKLDEADFRATDRDLRARAIAILRELDELEETEPPASG